MKNIFFGIVFVAGLIAANGIINNYAHATTDYASCHGNPCLHPLMPEHDSKDIDVSVFSYERINWVYNYQSDDYNQLYMEIVNPTHPEMITAIPSYRFKISYVESSGSFGFEFSGHDGITEITEYFEVDLSGLALYIYIRDDWEDKLKVLSLAKTDEIVFKGILKNTSDMIISLINTDTHMSDTDKLYWRNKASSFQTQTDNFLDIINSLCSTDSDEMASSTPDDTAIVIVDSNPAISGDSTGTDLIASSLPCDNIINNDALGGIVFETVGTTGLKEYGCRIVTNIDRYPVYNGSQSVRIEVRPGDCSVDEYGDGDCTTDRSRYEIGDWNSNNPVITGISHEDKLITYEVNLYIPNQDNLKPQGNNILILTQFNWADHSDNFGVLAYLMVDNDENLFIQTHQDFTLTPKGEYKICSNPFWNAFGEWINFKYMAKATTNDDGFIKVYVNDVLMVHETRATLLNSDTWIFLKFGIYNAYVSRAEEDFKTQIVYYDGVKKPADDCIFIGADMNIPLSCATYTGQNYSLTMEYDFLTGSWMVKPGSVEAITSGSSCIHIDTDLAIPLSCVEYQGQQYDLTLEFNLLEGSWNIRPESVTVK